MAEPTDRDLLTNFARTGAESPFATLVARHVNLVYSAALRFTSDSHQAEEITQAVFIILARKAGKLSQASVLTGWLYQTARLTAANALKEKHRRQQREHQAYLEATMTPNETNEAWRQLAPVLDEAMHALRTADRDAVLLRYFENKTLADVGAALGVTEDAARVRVNRALDKLRALLAKQGIKFGATAIATAVAANAVSAAPATLAASITTAVLTGTSLTLATVAMTTLQKIAVTAALTVTIGGGLFAAKQAHDAQNAVRTLQAQQAPMAEQIQQLQAERDKATNQNAWLNEELAKNEKNNSELLKLRGSIGTLTAEAGKLKAENERLLNGTNVNAGLELVPQKDVFAFHSYVAFDTAKEIALALRCCESMHHSFPTNFNDDLVDYYQHHVYKRLYASTNGLDVFEMVPNVNLTGLNSDTKNIVMIRERQARQTPDGKWERVYAFTDGTAQPVVSDNGDFSAFESEHLPTSK